MQAMAEGQDKPSRARTQEAAANNFDGALGLLAGAGAGTGTDWTNSNENTGGIACCVHYSSVCLVSGVWCVVDAPAAKYWHSSISSSNTQQ